MSEWLKVMLEEIARKKAEAEQARAEERLRSDEQVPRESERERERGPDGGAAPSSSEDRKASGRGAL